jgi:hypothetical protein
MRTTKRFGPRVIFKSNGEHVITVQYLSVREARVACIKWWLGLPDPVRTWSILRSQAYGRVIHTKRRRAA